jgi:hypothetical protein
MYMCSPTLWSRCHLMSKSIGMETGLREAYERRVCVQQR